MTEKPAHPDHTIHPLIRARWSPRAFSDRPLSGATLRTLFEAARWSASSRNEQPWRFIVARREESGAFGTLLGCLNESNQTWAQHASALVLVVASSTFSRNGKPNRHAFYDAGLAVAQLTLQATSLGVSLHQMAGFSSDAARASYAIPDGFEPVCALAIGYAASPESLPEPLAAREVAPRTRKKQHELVFSGDWGHPFATAEEEAYGEVLSFWFGVLTDDGGCTIDVAQRWWTRSEAFDQEIRERFEPTYTAIASGGLEGWRASAHGRLASIVVLDQFSRNMYRGTPGMYAEDERAQSMAFEGLERGLDQALPFAQRAFFYMPLMHSEQVEHQDRCVALFEQLREAAPESLQEEAEKYVDYAIQHRDIVARFGRFPHRNAILSRDSTPEEVEFLKQPGSSF